MKVTAVAAGIAFPHALLAIQVTRRTRRGEFARWHTETVCTVTDLDFDDITPSPASSRVRTGGSG